MIRAAAFLRPSSLSSTTVRHSTITSSSTTSAGVSRVCAPKKYGNSVIRFSSSYISSSRTLAPSSSSLLCNNYCNLTRYNSHYNNIATTTRRLALRASSSSSSASNNNNQKDAKSSQSNTSTDGEGGGDGGGEPTSQEIVLTPGEKVVAGTRLFFWAGAFAFASVCAYYIGKELLPTKMSPNTVFDKASSIIRQNTEVKKRFGDSFKTYGRDHGGHREGRRNFIEHTEYTNPDDNTKRTRVRFNLDGPYGQAFVFAEVSKDMPSGEFVYILVQDKRNGAVITVVDNRSALLAKKLAGGSAEGQNVFSTLLGGGGGGDKK